MGTIADLAVVCDDSRQAQIAIDAALAELRFVDRTMTRFADSSDVGRANLRAASEAVPICEETCVVVSEALRWAEGSDGAFDPCVGAAVALWDVGRRTSPPPASSVSALAGRRLYRTLELDAHRTGPALRFRDRDTSLDLGGIAKGYGVDRAVAALRAHGMQSALVNVGGDLYALGTSEDGDAWRVGIRSPVDPSALLTTLDVRDEAVATSGDYQQYFRYGDRRYHHLLDPGTGAPRLTDVHSLTVVASRCMQADAAATAAFGMASDSSERVIARLAPGARIVHAG